MCDDEPLLSTTLYAEYAHLLGFVRTTIDVTYFGYRSVGCMHSKSCLFNYPILVMYTLYFYFRHCDTMYLKKHTTMHDVEASWFRSLIGHDGLSDRCCITYILGLPTFSTVHAATSHSSLYTSYML
jgi:hypothetical protein